MGHLPVLLSATTVEEADCCAACQVPATTTSPQTVPFDIAVWNYCIVCGETEMDLAFEMTPGFLNM